MEKIEMSQEEWTRAFNDAANRRPQLAVRDSHLPHAGLGVFVQRDFGEDQIIAQYEGRHLDKRELDFVYGNGNETVAPYSLEVDEDHYIDADPEVCVAAPINDLHYLNQVSRAGSSNCRCVRYSSDERDAVFVVTTRHIQEGEELYFSYGSKYWSHLDLSRVPRLLDAIWVAGVILHGFGVPFKRRALLLSDSLRPVYDEFYDGKDFKLGHSGGYASLSSLLTKAHARSHNSPLTTGRGVCYVNMDYTPYDSTMIAKFYPRIQEMKTKALEQRKLHRRLSLDVNS